MAGACLALFGATLSGNLSIAHDSIHYINTIDAGRDLYHPHHLLYAPLARAWLWLLRHMNLTAGFAAGDSAKAVALLNAVFGAATIGLFHGLCRMRLDMPRVLSLIGCGLAAFSFGLWYYSTCVEVYAIPAFWLLLTFLVLTSQTARSWTCVAAGLTWGLAVLFHQTNVLFAVPVASALIFMPDRLGVPRDTSRVLQSAWSSAHQPVPDKRPMLNAFRGLAVCTTVAALIVAVPYALVLSTVIEPDSWDQAWHWLTDYAQQPAWGHWEATTLPKAFLGLARAIIGGHFVLAAPSLSSVADRVLGEHSLLDERFLVRHIYPRLAWALVISSIAACGCVAAAMVGGWRSRSRGLQPARSFSSQPPCAVVGLPGPSSRRTTVITASAWLVTYAVFFAWWEPDNLEFWIAPSIAFWLLVLTVARRGRRGAPLLAAAAILLFGVNLLGSIRYLRTADNDCYRHRATIVAPMVRPGDGIVLGRGWIRGDYLARYTPADVWSIADYARRADAAERLAHFIETRLAADKRVLVAEDAVDQASPVGSGTGESNRSVNERAVEPSWDACRTVLNRYRPVWRRIANDGLVFYEIAAATGQ